MLYITHKNKGWKTKQNNNKNEIKNEKKLNQQQIRFEKKKYKKKKII